MSSFGSVSSSLYMAFGVSGSGAAKISASRIALSSALACPSSSIARRPGFAGLPSGASLEPQALPSCRVFISAMIRLRIADGMRGIRRARAFVHANGTERPRLENPNELQPDHLEEREKGDDQAAAIVDIGEQILESARFGFRQSREQLIDEHFDGNLLRRQQKFRPQL